MTITADESRELARGFRNLAKEVGEHAWENRATISQEELNTLDAKERRLLDSASDMVDLAVGIDLATAQTSVAELNGVTLQAKEAVKNIQQAKRVIELATITIQFAAAISTQNPAAIGQSLQALSTKLDEIANA